jgi:hypothetical protein
VRCQAIHDVVPLGGDGDNALLLDRAGHVVGVLITPALELLDRNQQQLPAGDELDQRLHPPLKRIDADSESGSGFLA